MDFIQDGGKIKKQKNIDHHGSKYILIVCHLPMPPTFSLVPTFKVHFYGGPYVQ